MSRSFESNGTSYDEAYDDEAYDDESFDGESFLSSAFRVPRFGPVNPSAYRGSAVLNTPAGQANVDLPPDLVSKREFKALEARVLANNKAIIGSAKALANLSMNIKKNAAADKKRFDGFQRSQMFTALLPPKLTQLTVEGATRGGTAIASEGSLNPSEGSPVTFEVKSTKTDLLTTLLPMIASGGMGGGGGGSDSSMMLPLILLMKDKEGSNGSDDNTTLLLLMMMMMK